MAEEGGIAIVGGGPAAHAAAAAYREAGGTLPLRILSREHELPYERPPLTKEYLRGEMSRADLLVDRAAWYREREVEVELGAEVTELDLAAGKARAAGDRAWSFERCLLATGARPLAPDVPGADGPDVRLVRTIADSDQLRGLAASAVLVVGSGFIGCEAAASLAQLGARVRMATLEASPQVGRLGAAASSRILGWLEDLGVELLAEAALAEIDDRPGGSLARFEDGREVAADAVVLALGIERNDSLAVAAGVAAEDGVLVDAAMVSSDPRLLAAGDVAAAENSAAGRRLRVEHWGEALNMGAVAGRTLAGEAGARWAEAPGFWSAIGERRLKYAGWGDGWDEVRFAPGAGGSFVARYGRDGELVGVLAHEDDEAYEAGKRAIEGRSPWS
ncbi:MAG TPA: FAD-dependent oxidoreductase [Solirubrobacterales bacterium]|jgi:NADPH-dependent 2,4-dienoyl-CoA reductase/sulfur reductase-like enzyme